MPKSMPLFPFVVGVCAALLAFALAAAPHSCDGGLAAYLWAGGAAVLLLGSLPFIPRFKPARGHAALQGLQHVAWACGAWVAGFFIADFQILCRLF